MSIFAKLFERDGKQVLVTLDEDEPGIVFKFRDDTQDLYVSPKITFTPKDEGDEAYQAAWDKAEKVFEATNADSAFAMRTNTLAKLFGGEV